MSAEPVDVCGVRSADRAECGLQTAGPDDIRGARTAEYCGLMRTTEFCYLIRQAVIFRQATVGVAQVSDPADTECSGAQRRSAECGTQQTFYKQELQQVGGLESAHAYSRTFRRYIPDPTMHLPEYGQPLP